MINIVTQPTMITNSNMLHMQQQAQCITINVSAMNICSWVTSKGGWTNIAVFDIMTLVSAYLGQTNLEFTVTISHIMGTVAYYLDNIQSGNSLTGCSF
jgi:hypothetical protein